MSPPDLATVPIFCSLSIYRFNFQLLPSFGYAIISPQDLATVLIFRSFSIYRFNFQLIPTFGFASVSPPDLATFLSPIFRSLSIYCFKFQLFSTFGSAVWLLWTRHSLHVCILHLPLNRRTGTVPYRKRPPIFFATLRYRYQVRLRYRALDELKLSCFLNNLGQTKLFHTILFSVVMFVR